MRVLRWGAFVSWLIVAGLAVGGFAAFSPKPADEATSTTAAVRVADGRGVSTGRILASAFANAAADRTFLTAASSTQATFAVSRGEVVEEAPVTNPAVSSTEVPVAPPPPSDAGVVAWPSGSACIASWYGPGFEGKETANGEIFDTSDFTAALHDVPFNTTVRVERLDTGAVTTVRVNDRGPYEWDGGWRRHPTRCIDLSEAAMAALGGLEDGLIEVTISY